MDEKTTEYGGLALEEIISEQQREIEALKKKVADLEDALGIKEDYYIEVEPII